MGRIAEALKRAEEERRSGTHPHGGTDVADGPSSGPYDHGSPGVGSAVWTDQDRDFEPSGDREGAFPGPQASTCLNIPGSGTAPASERSRGPKPAAERTEESPRSDPAAGPSTFDLDAMAPAPADRFDRLSESLVPFLDNASPITEQYRSLRTRILSLNPNHEHRVIAVTSAVPKEGKSVTTLNLACVLAEIRHLRVLVVDGDFRRSSLAQMLGQPTGPGLADVLSGNASYQQILQDTPLANLKFIPAGDSRKQTAAQLLTETCAQTAFHRMRQEFDYTLVDTPPATTVTDVGILGPFVCGVILVVRLHRTHEAAARRAVRLLQVNNVPILGSLIVGRDAPADSYGYAHHYAYQRYYQYIKQSPSETPTP